MDVASHHATWLRGCGDEAHCVDRRLRLHGRGFRREAHRRGWGAAPRPAPAPRRSGPRILMRGPRAAAAGDVGYRHVKELAPTTELRRLQYREDDRRGVGKRNRIALAPEYAER